MCMPTLAPTFGFIITGLTLRNPMTDEWKERTIPGIIE